MNYEEMFKNKVILITGGTGFLGRALVRRILHYNPQSIRLFSRDEVKHYKTQMIFENNPRLRNFIGNVRDYNRIKKAMQGVDIVIHAAALKRLDILEYNVEESIKTKWVRKKLLDELEYHNPEWPKRWLNFDKSIKRLHKYKG